MGGAAPSSRLAHLSGRRLLWQELGIDWQRVSDMPVAEFDELVIALTLQRQEEADRARKAQGG